MHRQGDVLLIPIPPQDLAALSKAPREDGDVVLAHGEATGHRHRFRAKTTELYTPWPTGVTEPSERIRHARELLARLPKIDVDGVVPIGIVELTEPDALVHEEHSAIPHEPGHYLALRQREYAPGEIRVVAD